MELAVRLNSELQLADILFAERVFIHISRFKAPVKIILNHGSSEGDSVEMTVVTPTETKTLNVTDSLIKHVWILIKIADITRYPNIFSISFSSYNFEDNTVC